MTSFKDMDLQPFLLEALEDIHFKEATSIQERVIPLVQEGEDLVVQSQTGTGKSHAFLLPLLNAIDPSKQEVQVVITAPSRELAEQLYEVAIQLVQYAPEEIVVRRYVGGTDKGRQIDQLDKSQPHVVIGTPGRLNDLVKSKDLKTYTSRHLVVDEADMTLEMGFLQDVDAVAGTMPEDLQMLVFSATIPQKLQPFLKKYMSQPQFIEAENRSLLAPTISNWLIAVKGRNRKDLLLDVLQVGYPYLVLIFANTKETVDELHSHLENQGLNVGKIHGDLDARERKREMRNIQNLDYQYVVATDLAARGIDIEGVSHVINYEIPTELEYFVHRVGRTGRNQMEGLAITFYDPDEEEAIEKLEDKGIRFEQRQIRNGEFVEAKDRNHRRNRDRPDDRRLPYDPEIDRIKRQNKKSIKPGYKKKIQKRMQENRRKQARKNRRRR